MWTVIGCFHLSFIYLILKDSGDQQHWCRGQTGSVWWSGVCQQRPVSRYYSGYGHTDRGTGGWLSTASLNWGIYKPTHLMVDQDFLKKKILLSRASPLGSTMQLWWLTMSSGRLHVCVLAAAVETLLTLWSTAPSCTSASSPQPWLTWRTLWQ